jgi:hypothetical protein
MPDELYTLLAVLLAVTAAAATLHATARPALLRLANPSAISTCRRDEGAPRPDGIRSITWRRERSAKGASADGRGGAVRILDGQYHDSVGGARRAPDPGDDVDIDVLTEVAIARPRPDVASFAADPANATAWYRNIRSVGCC